jgi:hypothetical protein
MAKQPAKPKPKSVSKPKTGRQKTAQAVPAAPKLAKLTYTAQMEVEVDIEIMPGHTAPEVLEAIRSGKADFWHDLEEVAIIRNGQKKVLAKKSSRCTLINDEYDDFDIEPR